MKNLILLLIPLLFISCAHHKEVSEKDIDLYCQDLNVLYQKIAVISSNIANKETTRTAEGGAYVRKVVKNCKNGFCETVKDNVSPIMKYLPNHPDANKNGYVAFPNISLAQEEADRIIWEQVYETVRKNSPVKKNFFFKDPRAKSCFNKYPFVKENLNYSEYLGRDTNI